MPLSYALFGRFYSSGRWWSPCTLLVDSKSGFPCKTNDVPFPFPLACSTAATMSLWSKMTRKGWLAWPRIPPYHLGISKSLITRELLNQRGACEYCCKIQLALPIFWYDIRGEGMGFIALRVKTTARPLSSRNLVIFYASPTHWRNT